jgi:hypothetical protein
MKALIVHIGDVMDAQKHGGHFTQITQTSSGASSPGQHAKRELGGRGGKRNGSNESKRIGRATSRDCSSVCVSFFSRISS